jgi:hypothetical protein
MKVQRSVLGWLVAGLTACGSRGADLLIVGTAGAATAAGGNTSQGTGGGPTGSPCWQNQLPAEVQPLPPLVSAAQACGGDTGAVLLERAQGMASDADSRAVLVGRWVPCGATTFSTTPHAGIEFGANGRWQLLTDSGSGLLPMTPPAAGRYYLLYSGQLDLRPETTVAASVLFLSVSRNALLATWDSGTATYARVAPAPLNGRDNPPSITDGTCTLVGTWDTAPASGGTQDPQATLSFDDQGNFIGGPPGAELCAGHTMYGTYQLSPGLFEITTNIGMGMCHWWYDGGWPITFGSGCATATLQRSWDNCTGGRGYLNNPTVLTRRP